MYKKIKNKKPGGPGQFLKEAWTRNRYFTLCGITVIIIINHKLCNLL